MENQRVTLFLRIEEKLKSKLETAAKEDGRSINKYVEQILKQNIEVTNEQDAEPARALR